MEWFRRCLHRAVVWIYLPWCCRQLDFLKYRNLYDGDSRILYPSVPCYQTTRRHIPEDSNFRSRHCDNMKSHFISSRDAADAVLFLQPILNSMKPVSLFSYNPKYLILSSLFLVPTICSLVLRISFASCTRLSLIYDALCPQRHYISAIFIFHLYLLNPLTHM